MGGPEMKDNSKFRAAGQRDARRLRDAGATNDTRILEIGCSYGRLPIGLLAEFGGVLAGDQPPPLQGYVGLDVDAEAVEWCSRNLPGQYVHLDVENARYNPRGELIREGFRFPFEDDSFELIYLYSVFSHMEAAT